MRGPCFGRTYGSNMSESIGLLPPNPPVTPSGWSYEHFVRKESVSSALSAWLQVVLVITGICSSVMAVAALNAASSMNTYLVSKSRRVLADLESADNATMLLLGVAFLLSIATFVLLVIFSFRAHKACSSLCAYPMKWARDLTIGSWFIPIANFIITPMIWVESDRIATAPRSNGRTEPGWSSRPINKMIVIWWSLYFVGLIMIYAIPLASNGDLGLSDYSSAMLIGAVGSVVLAVSCVLAALCVRRLGRALSPTSIG
jgi:Domain of unknown function (DUF4328)